jgi:hypothetical protein
MNGEPLRGQELMVSSPSIGYTVSCLSYIHTRWILIAVLMNFLGPSRRDTVPYTRHQLALGPHL